ncbi:MAG: hypothetical protein ACI9YH_002306, partial [Colwellia sp.]
RQQLNNSRYSGRYKISFGTDFMFKKKYGYR